jgi:hypothetical protein
MPNFPRSYVSGFVGSAGITNMVVAGQALDWDYLFPIVHAHFPILTPFYTPSSNIYSLDHVFDEPACVVTVFGSPISGDVYVDWLHAPQENAWRVWVYASLTLDTSIKADLPPYVPSWNP